MTEDDFRSGCRNVSFRDLKQQRRQRQQKRHLKIERFYLCYFAIISSRPTFTETANYQRTIEIGRSGVQVKKESEKFTVLTFYLEFGHFT